MLFQTPPISNPNDIHQFETFKWLLLDVSHHKRGEAPYPISTFIGTDQYVCIFMQRSEAENVKTSIGSNEIRILEFTAPYGAHQMLGMWLGMIEDLEAAGIMIILQNGFHFIVPNEKLRLWLHVAQGQAMNNARAELLTSIKRQGKWLSYAKVL